MRTPTNPNRAAFGKDPEWRELRQRYFDARKKREAAA